MPAPSAPDPSPAAAAEEREPAAESQAVEQASRLRDVRGRLLERHSSGARARTEAEVATFRTEMEDRLHAARDGRQRAFADFNHRKERALGQLLPLFGEAYARAAVTMRLSSEVRITV